MMSGLPSSNHLRREAGKSYTIRLKTTEPKKLAAMPERLNAMLSEREKKASKRNGNPPRQVPARLQL
jgi:hypothetical protein